MGKLIQWDEIYCFQKILPLLTRWQLFHKSDCLENVTLRGSVQPDFIKKKRNPKGVPSYEIIWKDEQGCFDALIPDNQWQMFYSTNKEKTEAEANQLLWSTIEPIDLVEKAYPKLVCQFEESKAMGKAKSKKNPKDPAKITKKSAKAVNGNEIEAGAVLENDQEKIPKARPKKTTSRAGVKSKNKKPDNLQPIDQFFQRERIKSKDVYESPKIKTTTKPMNLSAFSLNFEDSLMMHEDDDDMNLSTIINEMIARPPNVTEFAGKKLRFDEVGAKNEEVIDSNRIENNDYAPKIDETLHVNQEKENLADNRPNADDSLDEFDMIVMRKNAKSGITKRNSLSRFSLVDADIPNCSTPVTRRRLLPTIYPLQPNSKMNLSLISKSPIVHSPDLPKSRKKSVISTSFFAVNPEDEIDLFEKSIDFRNMQDVESDNESDESSAPFESSATSKSSQQDDDINQYDTFDRLVGLN